MQVADLHIDRAELADCCHRYGVARLETFGSFATGDASPESDLDLLVTFDANAHTGLEFVAFQQELAAIFGRSIDLLTRESVQRAPNKYFRHFALRHTEAVYES
jgi:uncharacterized protein